MASKHQFLDKPIRCALTRLLRERDSTAAIINELPLLRTGRADVAAVNGVMSGYEIKSEADSLARLPLQIPMYEAVFDYCSIVVAEVHLKRARTLVSKQWGIFVASPHDDQEIAIRQIRPAKLNRNTRFEAIMQLMWKHEIVRCLNTNGIQASSTESVFYLWQKMAMVPTCQVMAAARAALSSRAV